MTDQTELERLDARAVADAALAEARAASRDAARAARAAEAAWTAWAAAEAAAANAAKKELEND